MTSQENTKLITLQSGRGVVLLRATTVISWNVNPTARSTIVFTHRETASVDMASPENKREHRLGSQIQSRPESDNSRALSVAVGSWAAGAVRTSDLNSCITLSRH